MNSAGVWIGGCIGILLLMALMAIIGGYLVVIVLGYFGISFTLWQGIVTAFTVSWLCKSTSTSTSK